MAVSIVMIICSSCFQVSFFIILHYQLSARLCRLARQELSISEAPANALISVTQAFVTTVAAAAGVAAVVAAGVTAGFRIHRVVVGLLEHHVLQQADSIDILLLHAAVRLLLLTDNHTFRLGHEQDAARRDGGRRAVLHLADADAGETDLKDTDTVQADFLAQFEEMLQRTAQLVEHGLDVRLLHRRLRLDKLSQLFGLDEAVVVHRRGIVLSVRRAVAVLVLTFNVLLTHLWKLKNWKIEELKFLAAETGTFESFR